MKTMNQDLSIAGDGCLKRRNHSRLYAGVLCSFCSKTVGGTWASSPRVTQSRKIRHFNRSSTRVTSLQWRNLRIPQRIQRQTLTSFGSTLGRDSELRQYQISRHSIILEQLYGRSKRKR